MNTRFLLPVLCAAAVTPAVASAQGAQESFDSGNAAGWAVDFGAAAPWDAAFGNPGGGIRVTIQNPSQVFQAPLLGPPPSTPGWSGDFRALGVSQFSYDRLVEMGSSNFGTPFNLVFGNDSGTPGNYSDDSLVFARTGDIIQFGSSPWTTFSLSVPSQSTSIPIGWFAETTMTSPLAGLSDDEVWNAVIQDVSYVTLAAARPLGGAGWFGGHIMRFDNFELDQAGLVGDRYCDPAVTNTSGQPTSISAGGSRSVAANTFFLLASDLPTNQFGIFLASRQEGFSPGANGSSDGNLCLGGQIGRFNLPNQILFSGTSGVFSLTVDLTSVPTPSAFVSVAAGETWRFQCWHRDATPLGSNFSDGVRVTFQQ